MNAGLTVTETDLNAVASLTDVAVTVTISGVLTFGGARYLFCALLPLLVCAIDPQLFTPAGHVTVQLTPALLASLFTLAVIGTLWFASSA